MPIVSRGDISAVRITRVKRYVNLATRFLTGGLLLCCLRFEEVRAQSLNTSRGLGAIDALERRQDEDKGLLLYTKKIKPLLIDNCYKCHSYKQDRFENGLSVEKRDDLINGGDRGEAIKPGEPDESLLIDALNYERDDLQMPPDGKLDEEDIEAIKEWIRLGAPYSKDSS